VVQEIAVVGHDGHRAGIADERVLKNVLGADVQVVGRFVENEQVGVEEHDFQKRQARLFAAG